MWIIAIIAVVVVFVLISRSSKGTSRQSLDSDKLRNMIDSTGDILTATRNLQSHFPQMSRFTDRLDRMHEVLCSYPREGFIADMTKSMQAVVAAAQEAIPTMPDEVQEPLTEYVESCRQFLATYGDSA